MLEHLAGLTEQNAIMQHMKIEVTSKQISTWKQVCDRLPTKSLSLLGEHLYSA